MYNWTKKAFKHFLVFWTTLKNLKKFSRKRVFAPEINQSDRFGRTKFDRKFGLRGSYINLWSQNYTQSFTFKVKNIASTTSEHLQSNFPRVKITSFLTQEIVDTRVRISTKASVFFFSFTQLRQYVLKNTKDNLQIITSSYKPSYNTENWKK